MPIKTVLVTGVDDPNNHYIKLCLDNFLRPTHIPWKSPKSIPKLDAAIIVASSTGHGLQWEARDLYEGKPIFFANGGVSSIREDFDKAVWGEGTLEKMRSTDVPFSMKCYFIFGRFFGKGDTFNTRSFKEKIDKVTKQDCKTNLSNILSTGKDKGMFGLKSPGNWYFKGLTKKIYDDLLKWGLFLEKESTVLSDGKTEILHDAMNVPQLLMATPTEPEPTEFVQPQTMPEPIPVQKIESEQASYLELLLEQSAKQDARIEELMRIVKGQQQTIAGLEQRITARFEETMHVHNGLFDLEGKLRGLDSESLSKASLMIGFVLENFTPRRVITPATPRQLS